MRGNSFTYSMLRACGVIYEDKIHLFGGAIHDDEDYTKQHIGFDANRNFIQYERLGKVAYTPVVPYLQHSLVEQCSSCHIGYVHFLKPNMLYL